jgi:hypothetical protein
MIQRFEMLSAALLLEPEKAILICRSLGEGEGKLWVKKLPDVHGISRVLEDSRCYYISCDYNTTGGVFLAVNRESGETEWYIPGRSLLHVLFKGFLYLIFIDEAGEYYLIKVELEGGTKIWYHRVDEDLYEYTFRGSRITLLYKSGRRDVLSVSDGKRL